jgi:hypothetical protein
MNKLLVIALLCCAVAFCGLCSPGQASAAEVKVGLDKTQIFLSHDEVNDIVAKGSAAALFTGNPNLAAAVNLVLGIVAKIDKGDGVVVEFITLAPAIHWVRPR